MKAAAPCPGSEHGAHARAPRSRGPGASDGLRIGISGSPESTPRSGSHHAVARCRELGLDALEMAWVQRVTMTESGAERVREASRAHDVRLSVHAPYYINLNSRDPDVVAASKARIDAAARAAAWCGAADVVLHLGFYHDDEPQVVFERMAAGLVEVSDRLVDDGVDVTLRPELMGRSSQFGDLDEILALCREVPSLAPCIDIAHLHARTGAWNSAGEFRALWRRVETDLGRPALEDAHIHISGIAYGEKGEQRHLPLEEGDLDYAAFLEVARACGVRGVLIAESPAREDDAVLVADRWRALQRDGAGPRDS